MKTMLICGHSLLLLMRITSVISQVIAIQFKPFLSAFFFNNVLLYTCNCFKYFFLFPLFNTVSSAHFRLFSLRPLSLIPEYPSRPISSLKRKKKSGDSAHPCLTHDLFFSKELISPSSRTANVCSQWMYMFFITRRFFFHLPSTVSCMITHESYSVKCLGEAHYKVIVILPSSFNYSSKYKDVDCIYCTFSLLKATLSLRYFWFDCVSDSHHEYS